MSSETLVIRSIGCDHRTRIARGRNAFSLLEVVVALGIFAGGIVAVLGLFGSLVRSARADREAGAAAMVSDLLASRLRAMSFAEVAALLRKNGGGVGDGFPDGNVFFANQASDKIGRSADAVWTGDDREKFFEIALLRNEQLSPPASDDEAAWIAFTVRVRWPAYRLRPDGSAVRLNETGQVQVLLLSGSVRR
jgi:type II secretory pathway pseudopilin PulG